MPKTSFRKNSDSPAANSIDFWWLWVSDALESLIVDKERRQWLTTVLLPVVYWHHKVEQTKKPKVKEKYRKAWEQATDLFKEHPLSATLSESEMQHWLTWADNMVRQFHTAVHQPLKGAMAVLSQMYHNGRGLSEKRLKSVNGYS